MQNDSAGRNVSVILKKTIAKQCSINCLSDLSIKLSIISFQHLIKPNSEYLGTLDVSFEF